MRVAFVKCHGSGNDFPMVDARDPALADAPWPAIARALADRSGPVGSDGLLLLTAGDAGHDFGMRMFNSDGSEAETCLNGLRCVARAGFGATDLARAHVRLKMSSADVAHDEALAPGVFTVREVVGPATLWGVAGRDPAIDAAIPELATARRFTAIAIPNPHLVSFVDHVDDAELVAIGEACESAPPWLPGRANVSFVEPRGDDLFVRTFERGVGLTNSCGSAMAASAYAACLTGRISYDRPLTVFNRGGRVRAEAGGDARVTLSGNATYEWRGWAEIDTDAAVVTGLAVTERYDDEVAAWDAVVG